MGLEVSLKVNHALEERLEVVGDLGAQALGGQKRAERLPRDRPGGRYAVTVAQDLSDLGVRAASLRELGRLRHDLVGRDGHPFGLDDRIRAVGTGPTLASGVYPRHGGRLTRVRYLTLGAEAVSRRWVGGPDPAGQAIRSVLRSASIRNALPSAVIR